MSLLLEESSEQQYKGDLAEESSSSYSLFTSLKKLNFRIAVACQNFVYRSPNMKKRRENINNRSSIVTIRKHVT